MYRVPMKDYQRALVAALMAELGGRGWSRKRLADESGLTDQTLRRVFRLERDMNVAQLAAMADALGVTIEHLAAEADRWSRELPATSSERPAQRPTDPRELIRWLMDNPSRDDVLLARFGEVESRTGVSGNALAGLR